MIMIEMVIGIYALKYIITEYKIPIKNFKTKTIKELMKSVMDLMIISYILYVIIEIKNMYKINE